MKLNHDKACSYNCFSLRLDLIGTWNTHIFSFWLLSYLLTARPRSQTPRSSKTSFHQMAVANGNALVGVNGGFNYGGSPGMMGGMVGVPGMMPQQRSMPQQFMPRQPIQQFMPQHPMQQPFMPQQIVPQQPMQPPSYNAAPGNMCTAFFHARETSTLSQYTHPWIIGTNNKR